LYNLAQFCSSEISNRNSSPSSSSTGLGEVTMKLQDKVTV